MTAEEAIQIIQRNIAAGAVSISWVEQFLKQFPMQYPMEIGERADNLILKQLLQIAICPECDGSGINAQQVGEQEWEAVQCQWCDTKNNILKND